MSVPLAVSALKDLPVFAHTSLRLLADLVEKAGKPVPDVGQVGQIEAALVVVLGGKVRVRGTPLGSAADGSVPPPRPGAGVLGPGDAYLTDHREFVDHALDLEAAEADGAGVMLFPADLLAEAAEASFSLARSLTLPSGQHKAAAGAPPAAHLVWLGEEAGLGAPLEALAQLLAAAIADDFHEPAAVVRVDEGGLTVNLWHAHGATRVSVGAPPTGVSAAEIVGALRAAAPPHDKPLHFFFVHPRHPNALPEAVAALRVHRVVYLTTSVPDRIPGGLCELLKPEVLNPADPCDAYFSSFIPVLVSRTSTPRRSGSLARGLVSSLLPAPAAPQLRTEKIEDAVPGKAGPRGWRLERDRCRLALDLDKLARRWTAWMDAKEARAFPAIVFACIPGARAAVSRWGRAVTNRQVGLALSGGGASAYRMVPLLRALRAHGVPIDVVGGISGGALLGAYYCTEDLPGVDRFIEHGPLYQLVVAGAVIDSQAIEWAVNAALGIRSITDLDVRFVPLTTALRDKTPPEAHVIVDGTLGEAVRASGGAPAAFAPTEKDGVRFTDGASATPVPAAILKDFGADLVFACNVVPGPEQRNPFRKIPGADLMYRLTPVGRLIDCWVWLAFLLQRVSKEAALDAHVFVEPTPVTLPFLESVAFACARTIVGVAARDPRLATDVQRCVDMWRRFAGMTREPKAGG